MGPPFGLSRTSINIDSIVGIVSIVSISRHFSQLLLSASLGFSQLFFSQLFLSSLLSQLLFLLALIRIIFCYTHTQSSPCCCDCIESNCAFFDVVNLLFFLRFLERSLRFLHSSSLLSSVLFLAFPTDLTIHRSHLWSAWSSACRTTELEWTITWLFLIHWSSPPRRTSARSLDCMLSTSSSCTKPTRSGRITTHPDLRNSY